MNAPTSALALAPTGPRALQLADDELIPTLRNSLFPGATDQSIKMVLGWCRATGKDPMKKPVHIVPMSVKKPGTRDQYEWRDVLMPGIVDYRTDAARTGQYAGNDEAAFGPDVQGAFGPQGNVRVTYPEWCEFKVYRLVNGERCAFSSGRVRWLESYATAGKDSDAPNAMWKKRPYGQLEKCAEAMALRRAFPEVGAQPTADEMVGKPMDVDEVVVDGVIVQTSAPAPAPAPAGPEPWPAEAFARWLAAKAQPAIDKGAKHDAVIAHAKAKGLVSPEQEAAIRALHPAAAPVEAATPAEREPGSDDEPPWSDDAPAAQAGGK